MRAARCAPGVELPGSKSITNRVLVLAALADGPSRICAPLRARDTLLMAAALRALGVGDQSTTGRTGWSHPAHCTAAPSTAGWRAPSCASCRRSPRSPTATSSSTATPTRATRPMGTLLDGLRQAGVRHRRPRHADGCRSPCTAPAAVDGGVGAHRRVGVVAVRVGSAAVRSRATPRVSRSCTPASRPVPSQPHVEMTVDVLRSAGVDRERARARCLAGRAGTDRAPATGRSSPTCRTPRRSSPRRSRPAAR